MKSANCDGFGLGHLGMKIYKAPNFLTVHFKRNKSYHSQLPTVKFSEYLDLGPYLMNKQKISQYNIQTEEFIKTEEIEKYRTLQWNTDIEEFATNIQSVKYELFGIVNHYGSQNFGHYTSACKVKGKWYEFNDSTANLIDFQSLVTNEAYILFYQRID